MKDTTIKDIVEIAGGSVAGTDHTRIGKANQDAFAIRWTQFSVVGVVCDGCGDPTSPHSEVGAQLLARLVVSCLSYQCERQRFDLRRLGASITGFLQTSVTALTWHDVHCAAEISESHALRDYFLCTILGFAITPDTAYFFGVGDGTLIVNGESIPLGPFPNNTPPYFAYSLMDSSLLKTDPGCLDFQLHQEIPTALLNSFLIGSDGAQEIERRQADRLPSQKEYLGGLSQFWTDRYYQNPQAVSRRLTQANTPHQSMDWENRGVHRYGGLLHDDTTIITGRAIPSARIGHIVDAIGEVVVTGSEHRTFIEGE